MSINLNTKAENTWCPGCINFFILSAFQNAVRELINEKKIKSKDQVAIVSGIGCHGKISDYLNVNSLISLHGREVPTLTGIKLANPNLTVVGFTGDGSAYDEGISHWIHAAKRNSNVNLFVHNNELFALTTGQVTATSKRGARGRSTPEGNVEDPLNPLALALEAGATFVARALALDLPKTTQIMKKAMTHPGFAMVDIIQPCITFADTREYYRQNSYWLDDAWPKSDKSTALKKIMEKKDKIAMGVFYEEVKPTFEELV